MSDPLNSLAISDGFFYRRDLVRVLDCVKAALFLSFIIEKQGNSPGLFRCSAEEAMDATGLRKREFEAARTRCIKVLHVKKINGITHYWVDKTALAGWLHQAKSEIKKG